jgi:tripartite-type tricarboxylate transporter receptor subunit TctC
MMEIFSRLVGINVKHVPYRGSAEVLQDLAAGRIDIYLETFTAAAPYVASGKIRYAAVGSDKRLPTHPDVPTFAEVGYPDYQPYTWSGQFVPARTPPAVVQKLNAALNTVLESAEFKEASKTLGILVMGPTSPEAAEQFARQERTKWVSRIRASGISVD